MRLTKIFAEDKEILNGMMRQQLAAKAQTQKEINTLANEMAIERRLSRVSQNDEEWENASGCLKIKHQEALNAERRALSQINQRIDLLARLIKDNRHQELLWLLLRCILPVPAIKEEPVPCRDSTCTSV
mmetsp:Transcript_45764/g.90135  ORF Transcript_45764/g.90135 Transcript_45764/m.90135 type:complete len:129 (+) Transcript_45764:281-667(+)